MSTNYTNHQPYPGQPPYQPGPGQQAHQPRYPNYRGQAPAQNVPRPYYQHHAQPPQGMPNQGQQQQVAHLNFTQFGGDVRIQYHPLQTGQQFAVRPGPPVSNPLTNAAGAPPFQPGNPYSQMIHYPPQQPVQMVYQTNGPHQQQHMAMGHAGHPAIFTPGQRFHAPAHLQTINMQHGNMSQAPPAMAPAHQQAQSQPQQQPQQMQQPTPTQMYHQHQQPPRPVVSAVPTSAPPPSTTPSQPSYQPPQQQQQQQQQHHQQQQQPPSQQQQPQQPPAPQPTPQPTATLRRERKPLLIVDPSTMKAVDVSNTSSSSTAEPTPEHSSTSSTPAPETAAPSSDSKPPTKVATEFATKVCALASEGSNTNEESSVNSVKEPSPAEPSPEPAPAPSQPVKVVQEPEVVAAKEKTPEMVQKPSEEVDSSSGQLSVSTDMKREDLYEPVSPTPLPDSPSDDTNKAVTEPANNDTAPVNNKPSPFEEVINKKAAGEMVDKEEEAFEEVKGKKKKTSTAAKKALLNSKGEKKGDLLDVITSIQDPKEAVNDVADKIEKMSINKPSESEKAGSPSEDAPKVNGVNDSEAADNNEELEDGEIVDDEDESKQKMTLKYDYPEDQWSPLNPTGKKQYGRDFLIRLQVDPLSLEKPQNLPKMEIVKDSPNLHNKASSGKFDFTPTFVKSQSRQGVNKRPSRDGRDRMGKGDGKKPMVISLPSISAEVKLNKAENAWMPKVKDKNKESDEGEDLRRKALAILNKLTPSNFSTLVDKFQGLHIDTEAKLSLCMELVFEKAVDEPSFSVAYAQMCRELQKKKVADENGQEVNFRKLLLTRCQQEFTKDYMEGLDKAKYDKDIEEAANPDDKKRIQMEYEAMEMKLRKRSLGNIRFIGELYKLQMLTVRIMHECVRKLLACDPRDEESLECLCRLLTTVGENLDKDSTQRLEMAKQKKEVLAGIYDLGNYFKDMRRLVSERKTSARVRFLIQDVIELRENNWRKRREDAGPKTIDQIHKEAEKEAKDQMIANLTQSMGPPPGRRDDRRDYRQDDRRRSTKGGPPAGGQSEDGWQMAPMKAARQQAERIDTSRISKLQNSKTDADNMSFGPPRGSGASWGRGSQSGKNSRQETPVYTNRFSQLGDQSESGPGSYEGRGSGGYPGRYPGRSSRDEGRAGALALVQGLNPRSQSVMGPHPTLSRENSVTGARSHSMVHTNNSQHTEMPLKGASDLSYDEVDNLTRPLIEEFLNIKNYDEALKEIAEKFSSNTITMFLSSVFNQVIEISEKARSLTGTLVSHLCLKRMVSQSQLLESLTHEEALITLAEDMIVDIPKFWDFLAQILAPVVSSGGVEMDFLKSSANGLPVSMKENCCAGKYVAAILSEMGRSDQSRVGQLWRDSGLSWADFLPQDKVNKFIADNKLEWTQQESSGGSADNISSQLASMLKSNKDVNEIISWVDSRCSDKLKTSGFIRALTTVILESCIDGYGGPNSECKINDSKLKERNRILKKYVGDDVKLQGEALVAVQFLIHRLEHPNKMLHSIFETFYQEDVIVEEAFIQWEQNTDPEAQDGKGVALKSCNQFLVYIKEAEPEDDDPE